MTQLRNCKAYVAYRGGLEFYVPAIMEIRRLGGYLLKSYDSHVAFLGDDGICYLFHKWDYSNTTMGHVRKFIDDYASFDYTSASDIRKQMSNCSDTQGNYAYATFTYKPEHMVKYSGLYYTLEELSEKLGKPWYELV